MFQKNQMQLNEIYRTIIIYVHITKSHKNTTDVKKGLLCLKYYCYYYYYYFQLRTAAFKAYCAILVRCSNFRHQAFPRVTTQEHPVAEGGTVGKKCPVILPKCRLPRYI